MTKTTPKEPNEKDLLELLELAQLAEKQAREMCEGRTANAKKVAVKGRCKTGKSTTAKIERFFKPGFPQETRFFISANPPPLSLRGGRKSELNFWGER